MRRLLIAILIAFGLLAVCLFALYSVFLSGPMGSRSGSGAGTAATGAGGTGGKTPGLVRHRTGITLTLPENMPIELPERSGSSAAATAGTGLQMSIPVACVIGQDCWVLSYTDQAAAKGEHKDYRCGPRSYDGHQGTDFAIGGIKAMKNGVQVLAAAKGKVAGVKDGVDDAPHKGALLPGAEQPTGESCGNWVLIDHGDGWMSRYCHLRKNSVTPKVGDEVTQGQVIGAIGLSGLTRIPHLHFEVTKDDKKIDPFVGQQGQADCQLGRAPLWSAAALGTIKYEPSFILDTGFAVGKPTSEWALDGKYVVESLPGASPSLSIWVYLIGARAGDDVRFLINGPDKVTMLSKSVKIDKGYASWFGYAGITRQGSVFPPGDYTGIVQVIRKVNNKAEVYVRPVRIKIEPR